MDLVFNNVPVLLRFSASKRTFKAQSFPTGVSICGFQRDVTHLGLLPSSTPKEVSQEGFCACIHVKDPEGKLDLFPEKENNLGNSVQAW